MGIKVILQSNLLTFNLVFFFFFFRREVAQANLTPWRKSSLPSSPSLPLSTLQPSKDPNSPTVPPFEGLDTPSAIEPPAPQTDPIQPRRSSITSLSSLAESLVSPAPTAGVASAAPEDGTPAVSSPSLVPSSAQDGSSRPPLPVKNPALMVSHFTR